MIFLLRNSIFPFFSPQPPGNLCEGLRTCATFTWANYSRSHSSRRTSTTTLILFFNALLVIKHRNLWFPYDVNRFWLLPQQVCCWYYFPKVPLQLRRHSHIARHWSTTAPSSSAPDLQYRLAAVRFTEKLDRVYPSIVKTISWLPDG